MADGASSEDERKTTTAMLARHVRGRNVTPFEERLVDVLHDEVFAHAPDLRPTEQCALSYRRLLHLRARMNLVPDELFDDVDAMLALHDWTCLLDGTLTTLLTIHYNLCLGSVLLHGEGRPELAPYVDELSRMESIGVFLATELGYGNNVQALETEAVFDAATRSFVLHTPSAQAQKFMPNTGADGVPKLAVVMARLKVSGKNRGVFPFLVRLRTAAGLCPGVRITPLGDKPDYGLDNAMTAFEHMRLPFENWLSGESRIDDQGVFSSPVTSAGRRFLSAMDRVQAGKLCLGVAALSMMRASLRIALDYARQRRTFAPGRRSASILSYRPYQRAMFEGVATAYASASFLEAVADRFRERRSGQDPLTDRYLALGKAFVSARALRIASTCREKMGAQGMFSANRVIGYWVGINGIVTAEGDNEIILLRAARELLVAHEYEPIAAAPAPQPAGLDSPEFLVWLVREHERLLRDRVTSALGAADARSGVFDTWNDNLSEALELASVHALRLSMEHFLARTLEAAHPPSRAVLMRLFRLFALAELSPFTMALVASGTLSVALASGFHAERERLSAGLHDDTELLIDAFGLPNSLLDVPVIDDYVAAYAHRGGFGEEPRVSYIRSLTEGEAEEARRLGA
jgi:acyl-CoA oxidase